MLSPLLRSSCSRPGPVSAHWYRKHLLAIKWHMLADSVLASGHFSRAQPVLHNLPRSTRDARTVRARSMPSPEHQVGRPCLSRRPLHPKPSSQH